jgi:hypothetical protein
LPPRMQLNIFYPDVFNSGKIVFSSALFMLL